MQTEERARAESRPEKQHDFPHRNKPVILLTELFENLIVLSKHL